MPLCRKFPMYVGEFAGILKTPCVVCSIGDLRFDGGLVSGRVRRVGNFPVNIVDCQGGSPELVRRRQCIFLPSGVSRFLGRSR